MTENSRGSTANKMFQVVHVETATDLVRKLIDLKGYVFRGQAQDEWRLQTTFQRAAQRAALDDVPTEDLTRLERKIINEFKRRA